MKASVIVSTYNGALKLPFLLDALASQSIRDFELICVVDGSTDNTVEILKSSEGRFFSLKIIEQANAGRSKVKNRGAFAASGDLLIFYDDDMAPYPNSVERHIERHADGLDKLVSGNPLELAEPGKTDIQNYKATRSAAWTGKYGDSITRLNADNLFFTAANCSLKKSVLLSLNGFDERLTDAEDFNLARQAIEKGVPVFFDRDNIAVHREFITAHSYVLRLRQYNAAHDKLAALFPSRQAVQRRVSPKIKRLSYRFFASPGWIRSIDSNRLGFLPVTMRYRLYDIILHALSYEYPDVRI